MASNAETRIHEAVNVIANMEGISAPITPRERYLLWVIGQIAKELCAPREDEEPPE